MPLLSDYRYVTLRRVDEIFAARIDACLNT